MKRVLIVIVVIIVLSVGYYGISPLFKNITVADSMPEEVVAETEKRGIIGTKGHPASGTVKVIEASGETIIRYENFETINGPNLHVYLAKDLDAKEFVDLGSIRGTRGEINYTVPDGIDLNEYKYVMYWCVPFGVLFNYADISS